MRQLYSNVNSGKLNGLTRPLTSADNEFRGNTLTKEQLDEGKEEQAKREARTDWYEKRFSEGHMTRALGYRARNKLPRWHWKRGRLRRAYKLDRLGTPKTVLNTLKRFSIT